MVFAFYRFICDVTLACLWIVAGLFVLLVVLLMVSATAVAAVIGGLIFVVMWMRDRPNDMKKSELLKM